MSICFLGNGLVPKYINKNHGIGSKSVAGHYLLFKSKSNDPLPSHFSNKEPHSVLEYVT